MDEKLAVSIVREIIRDIYGRYGMEQFFRSIEPRIQVNVYEQWIHVVSKELKQAGVIEEVYKPLETEKMSFVDIINRSDFYLKSDGEEE